MKLSRTAIRELTAKYRDVLMKCFAIAMAITMAGVSSNAMADNLNGITITNEGNITTGTGGRYSVRMGEAMSASGDYSTAMGYNANASGQQSVAIGSNSFALGTESVAIGSSSKASATNSLAMMGGQVTVSGTNSVAIGTGAIASTSNTIALGSSAYTTKIAGTLDTANLKLNGTALTATATELNVLDGITATTAELNYMSGVTSNVQTQLNSKANASDYDSQTGTFKITDTDLGAGQTTQTIYTTAGAAAMTKTSIDARFTDASEGNSGIKIDRNGSDANGVVELAGVGANTFTGDQTVDGKVTATDGFTAGTETSLVDGLLTIGSTTVQPTQTTTINNYSLTTNAVTAKSYLTVGDAYSIKGGKNSDTDRYLSMENNALQNVKGLTLTNGETGSAKKTASLSIDSAGKIAASAQIVDASGFAVDTDNQLTSTGLTAKTATVSGNATIGGTLGVTGVATFEEQAVAKEGVQYGTSGNYSIDGSGYAKLNGLTTNATNGVDLGLAGNTTDIIGSTVNVGNEDTTTATLFAGTKGITVSSTNNTSVAGDLNVNGATNLNGATTVKGGDLVVKNSTSANVFKVDNTNGNTTIAGTLSVAGGSVTGSNSVAMGQGTQASGQSSIAMGASTKASGSYSTAMGQGTQASGQSSTAMGASTKASASYSTAMGFNTTASGLASTTVGSFATAIGSGSFAGGYGTSASAAAGVAYGQSSFAFGTGAVAGSTLTTNDNQIAMGYNAKATGDEAVAIGNSSTASATNSLAMMGGTVTASANNSVAIGIGAVASTANTIALGGANYATNIAGTLNVAGVATFEEQAVAKEGVQYGTSGNYSIDGDGYTKLNGLTTNATNGVDLGLAGKTTDIIGSTVNVGNADTTKATLIAGTKGITVNTTDTSVAGNLNVNGATTVKGGDFVVQNSSSSNVFKVDNTNGNTTIAGTLNVSGKTTLDSTNGLAFGTGPTVTAIDVTTTNAYVFGDNDATTLATMASLKSQAQNGTYTNLHFEEGSNIAATTTINAAIQTLDTTIGELTKLNAGEESIGDAMTKGTGNRPTTIVQALNNIDETIGDIHGLRTKLEENAGTTAVSAGSNLATGTTVEDHLTAMDASIGNRTAIGSSNAAINAGTANSVAQGLYAAGNAIGNQQYTSYRYVSQGSDLTNAVSALDRGLGNLEDRFHNLDDQVDKYHEESKAGFASVSALSALVPNARTDSNTQLAGGFGYYHGATGFALGAFHYVNDNVLLNVGGAYAGDASAAFRAGFNIGF